MNGVCVPASALQKFVEEWQALKEGETAPLAMEDPAFFVFVRIPSNLICFEVNTQIGHCSSHQAANLHQFIQGLDEFSSFEMTLIYPVHGALKYDARAVALIWSPIC